MTEIIQLLDDPATSVAVVGATDTATKYGSVIYRDLKRKGYPVYAVNPNRETVDGDPAYADVGDLPAPPGIIDLVVPAHIGVGVVRRAIELGYDHIWVQPGAESPELLTLLQESGVDYIADACIMVRTRLVQR
jgi:uncharacterized protein